MVKPIGGPDSPQFPDRSDIIKKIEKPAEPAEVGRERQDSYTPKTREEQIEAAEKALAELQPELMRISVLSEEAQKALRERIENLNSQLRELKGE